MGLYSTPIGDGLHEVQVDFPYAPEGKRRKYFQWDNKEEALEKAAHFVDFLNNRGVMWTHIHHDPDRPAFDVIYID